MRSSHSQACKRTSPRRIQTLQQNGMIYVAVDNGVEVRCCGERKARGSASLGSVEAGLVTRHDATPRIEAERNDCKVLVDINCPLAYNSSGMLLTSMTFHSAHALDYFHGRGWVSCISRLELRS